ncbi:MAG TPA: c-type cytochrome [Nitrospiria bacterium]|nr:c-type cytochrome [Nitrospiria bacterium]
MWKKTVIVIGFGMVLGSLWAGAWFVRHGFSAKDEPSVLELKLARYLRHLAVPRQQREAKNPIPATPEILTEAREHFADHCAVCHGNDGSGKTDIGQGVYPKAPDLRQEETQLLSDGELFYIIHNGIRFTAMPGWGTGRPEDDRDSWKLVRFIRHLPVITEQELEEMKRFNPVSQRERERQEEEDRFLRGEPIPLHPEAGHMH